MVEQRYFIEDCVAGMRSRVADGTADMVFADPPFNIGFNKMAGIYGYGVSGEEDIYYSDNMTRSDYIKWAGTWISEVKRSLKKDGIFVLMSGWNNVSYLEVKAHEAGFETLNHVIWYREFGPQTKRKFVTAHYHYLILLNGRVKDGGWTFRKNNKHDYVEDVFGNIRRLTKKYTGIKHPCKLNEDVHVKFFKLFTKPGELIVDIFMGAGSSIVAAKKTGRNYIGFEINPEYEAAIKEMIARRIGKNPGKKTLDAFIVPPCQQFRFK
jgi:site-specific DNA-methyltransferase (adenine-specific)